MELSFSQCWSGFVKGEIRFETIHVKITLKRR